MISIDDKNTCSSDNVVESIDNPNHPKFQKLREEKLKLRNPHPDPNIIRASEETSAMTLLNTLGTGRYAYISREKGRGVLAVRELPAGTLVERAPLLYLTEKDAQRCEDTRLYSYSFGVGEEESGFALGFGSLYNHGTGDVANMRYQVVQEEVPLCSKTLNESTATTTAKPDVTSNANGSGSDSKPPGTVIEKVEDANYPDYNLFVEFWTKRTVQPDEELLIDYQQRYGEKYSLWFNYGSKKGDDKKA